MQYDYTPYKQKNKKKLLDKLPKIPLPKGIAKWIGLLVGFVVVIFLIFYLCLGELRFFANHFFGLTFFSKNYVVLLQNNYELRPGGGFITGYGNLDTFMGFTKNLSFKNSYDIDTKTYVTPPYPHEDLLKNEWYQGYTFRDANWDPHFPASAKELTDFYLKKFPKKDVDGFIVVNFSMIEDLIDELGGIELNGKTLTKNNLFSEMEFAVNNVDRHNVDALKNRKNILGDIGSALMKKAKWSPFTTKNIVVESLNNKNMYIWLKNKRLQKKLNEKGWANTLVQPELSDFLSVNLANLGSKKADRYVQTEVHYYADISKMVPKITTEVTIRYPGSTNTYSDNYKGYLRVFIPKKSEIINSPVDSKTETGDNFEVIGTKIKLPAGSKINLTYTYSLPRYTFKHDQYNLRLAKQSGSETLYKLTIEANQGKIIKSSQFVTRENKAMFTGYLKKDLDLSLKVLPDKMPPYPIEQEFKDLKTIKVIWNEPIDKTNAENIKNYTVSDLNKENKTVDQINVTTANLIQANVVELTLGGVTEQTMEHYKIDMKGIKDTSGNAILPNPKSITAVQRIKEDSKNL